jgi:cell division protein FtsW
MSTRLSIICIWFCFITLLVLGIMMVASTGLCAPVGVDEDPASFLYKQSSFALLGLTGALVVSCIDYHILRRIIKPIWIGLTILLICCFLPVIGMNINGENRWINLGFMSFQPSELAKSVLMICLAHWYTTHREMAGTFWRGFVAPGMIFGIPLLLILVEKDMGTAAALAMSGFCVMYVAGVRGWVLALCILLGAMVLFDQATGSANRLERIYAWFDPEKYRQSKVFNDAIPPCSDLLLDFADIR